jgi:ABC-type amino acid transport system permease subunit
MPRAIVGPQFVATEIAFLVAIVLVVILAIWARRHQLATGRIFPTFWTGVAVLLGLPFLVFLMSGAPLAFEFPQLKGFNFIGGWNIKPEFMALLLGLSLYTATYIAEIVRAAQREAEANGILGHGLHQPLDTLFDGVFEEMPWHLREQQAQMIAEETASGRPWDRK